jgi:hypothetical protein
VGAGAFFADLLWAEDEAEAFLADFLDEAVDFAVPPAPEPAFPDVVLFFREIAFCELPVAANPATTQSTDNRAMA